MNVHDQFSSSVPITVSCSHELIHRIRKQLTCLLTGKLVLFPAVLPNEGAHRKHWHCCPLLTKPKKSTAIPRQSGTRRKQSTSCSTLSAFSYFLGKLILLSLHLQLQSLTANSDLVQLITTYVQYGLRYSRRTNFKIRLKEEIWSNSSAVILQMRVRSSSGKHWGSHRGQKVNSRGLKKATSIITPHTSTQQSYNRKITKLGKEKCHPLNIQTSSEIKCTLMLLGLRQLASSPASRDQISRQKSSS